jgi:hypothetical protein
MADDRRYVGGDNYILDDLSGFKIRASRARIIPGGQTGGLAVAPDRWEPQQPQDFVTGVRDDQTVAVSRPRQQDQFVILGTYATAFSPLGASSITVDITINFLVDDVLQIMLDTGVNFYSRLTGIVGKTCLIDPPLPATVGGPKSGSGSSGNYGDPIENSVLNIGPNNILRA